MATRTDTNPMADALGSGLGRRRKPGETAGNGQGQKTPGRARERRVAVDVPSDLYTEAKLLAVRLDMTIKQVMVDGLRAEVQRLHSAAGLFAEDLES